MRLRIDAHNATPALVRRCHKQISITVKRQPLRPAQATEEHADLATLGDAVDAIEARSRRP